MAGNFKDLPTEIWLLIAQYLSKSELSKIKLVNSFFFDCWMGRSWEEVHVEITARYSKSVVRLFERMLDPFVAVRTKTLSIVLKSRKLASTSSSTSRASFSLILAVLPVLPNITFLSINLYEHSALHVATFFRTVTSSTVARTLQNLSLSGNVEGFASLAEYSADNRLFKNLTQLILDLGLDNSTTHIESSLILEPFLRSLAPTLQILRVFTHSSELDLSPLFNALLQPPYQSDIQLLFPNLKSLYIALPFELAFRSFPQSLHRFLLIYNKLQHLHLDIQNDYNPDIEVSGELLANLLNSSQFSSLRSLDIDQTCSQSGFSAVLALIKRNAQTLSSLKLFNFDCYLTCEEVEQLVDALTANEVHVQGTTTMTRTEEPRKLKSLSMNIAHLSVSFLDLLAHKLPQLESLFLTVSEIIGSDQYSFCDHLYFRRSNPNTTCAQDVLHTWKLHNLSIVRNWKDERDVVHAVAGAVPALSRGMASIDNEES